MIKILTTNFLRFLFLIILQVFILNNIQFSGFINPYLYLLFILMLPLETPDWLLIVLSFVTGVTIDIFSSTIGMHSAACVLIGYLRPKILQLISSREEHETKANLSMNDYGFNWFLKYSLTLVFIHHFVLFYLEIFRFSEFFTTLLRVISSTFFTMILVFLSQFFIRKK